MILWVVDAIHHGIRYGTDLAGSLASILNGLVHAKCVDICKSRGVVFITCSGVC
jgi:hypothetical protein